MYNSPAVATLKSQLPRQGNISVILDGHTLSIRAEIETTDPNHLCNIVDAGKDLRKLLA
jgi:hypothetical protein